MKTEEVLNLTWKELNAVLLKCHDEEELQTWLAAAMAHGGRTRCKRILGRLRAVRKAAELAALPPKARRWSRKRAA